MENEIFNNNATVSTDFLPQESVDIKSLIYIIRGQQVMLDSDLAMLYQVETGNLNKARARNKERFPDRYCFQLTKEEYETLLFQIGRAKVDGEKRGGRRTLPYAFTEHGALALSYVLRSKVAIAMGVRITDEFVAMRKIIANYSNVLPAAMYDEIKRLQASQASTDQKLQAHQIETDEKIQTLFSLIEKYELPKERTFLCGDIYDAFTAIVDLIKRAKISIVLVDGYTKGMDVLNILMKKREGVDVVLYTKPTQKPTDEDIAKFNEQYPHLEIKTTNRVHDRYLFIDNEEVYHFGPSIKDAGGKTFTFSRMENLDDAFRILQDIEDNLET